MKSLLVFVLAILTILALGWQNAPHVKKSSMAGVDPKSTVTRAEAASVFARARKAIIAAHIGNIPAKATIVSDNKPVTRDEVIIEMAKLLESAKKAIKLVPSPVRYDASQFKVGAAAKPALSKLAAWGFVAPVGPLATGPKPTLTIQEFGDALGFYLSRFCDVTHMPSTKWSPYLQSD